MTKILNKTIFKPQKQSKCVGVLYNEIIRNQFIHRMKIKCWPEKHLVMTQRICSAKQN